MGYAAALVLAAHGVLAWIGRAPGILTGQDDALYVTLARALLQGTYRDLHRIDAPLHALYPPGYPAALAAWGSVFGFGFDAVALFSIVCSVIALALIWDSLARLFSPGIALAVLIPAALNPVLLQYAGTVASESPFLLATTVPLWLASRAGPGRVRGALGIGITAVLAGLTRAAGLAMLLAVVVHWLLERRWKRAIVFAVAGALFYGGWLGWSSHAARESESHSYLTTEVVPRATRAPPAAVGGAVGHILAVPQRMARNFFQYATESVPWALAVPTIRGTVADNLASMAIALACAAVGIGLLLRKWRLAGLYLAAYSTIVLAYPWIHPRFVTPVAPLLLLVALAGAAWWSRKLDWRPLRLLVPAMSLALALGGAARALPAVVRNAGCDRGGETPDPQCLRPGQVGYFEALKYMKQHVSPDAVILNMKAGTLFHYTGLRTIANLDISRPPDSTFVARVRDAGGGYILLGTIHSPELPLSRRMLANCDALVLEAGFPSDTYLFRVAAPTAEQRRQSCKALVRYRHANVSRDFGVDS